MQGLKVPNGYILSIFHVIKDSYNILFYTTGPLNAWIWLAGKPSKVCNYFQGNAQANVFPCTALHDNITLLNYLRSFKGPYSLKQQNDQNPPRHWPNKYRVRLNQLPCSVVRALIRESAILSPFFNREILSALEHSISEKSVLTMLPYRK